MFETSARKLGTAKMFLSASPVMDPRIRVGEHSFVTSHSTQACQAKFLNRDSTSVDRVQLLGKGWTRRVIAIECCRRGTGASGKGVPSDPTVSRRTQRGRQLGLCGPSLHLCAAIGRKRSINEFKSEIPFRFAFHLTGTVSPTCFRMCGKLKCQMLLVPFEHGSIQKTWPT